MGLLPHTPQESRQDTPTLVECGGSPAPAPPRPRPMTLAPPSWLASLRFTCGGFASGLAVGACALPDGSDYGWGLRLVVSAVLGWGVFETSPRLRVRWLALTGAPPFFKYFGGGWFSRFALRHRLSRRPAGGAPTPRPCFRRGAPLPLLLSPARYARAPPRWSGLREIGVPLRGALLSATALHRSRGLFAVAPASVGLGACFALVVPPSVRRSLRSL